MVAVDLMLDQEVGTTFYFAMSEKLESWVPLHARGVACDTACRFKVILVGASGVGKTCLMKRFINGVFDPTAQVTRIVLLLRNAFFYLN